MKVKQTHFTGFTLFQVVEMVRARVTACGSQAAAARELGVTRQHLGEVLAGTRTPGNKILSALGLASATIYVRE